MPHSVRDVATTALRKLGVLRSGGVPSAGDAEDARLSLQSWYAECIDGGTFGRVWNIPVSRTGSVTPYPNQHVNVLTDDPVTVTPPSTVAYDYWNTWMPSRDYGWGLNVPLGGDTGYNVPRDKAVVMVTYQASAPDAAMRLVYVYDGTIQRWMRVDTLTLDDEAPLSARGFDGLASLLAIRLTDQFGEELLGAASVRAANRYKLALVTNYGNGEDYEYARSL
jgi:hypothetical protein